MLKYERIAQDITSAIANDEYNVGDKLPSVEQLKARYKVSKSTIIKALAILQRDGMIFQTRGSGIYVRNKNKSGYINLLKTKGFSDNLQGHQITSKVLTFETIKPNDEVRAHLRLTEQDEEVYYVERIRYLDHNPLCIETSYFNKTLVTHLDHDSANIQYSTIYKHSLRLISVFLISISILIFLLNVKHHNWISIQMILVCVMI